MDALFLVSQTFNGAFMTSLIKDKILQDMKTAMRSQEKERLAAIRFILAGLKQREVDERIVLNDEQVIGMLNKMIKQRRDSIAQYTAGNRPDLAAKENEEVRIIESYLPPQMEAGEIEQAVKEAIQQAGASSPKDMGKVMGILKTNLQGKADMAVVSAVLKSALSALGG